ncbi:hypothetical protein ACQKWADRAFT_284972 [Trichoderma austrokoningii]
MRDQAVLCKEVAYSRMVGCGCGFVFFFSLRGRNVMLRLGICMLFTYLGAANIWMGVCIGMYMRCTVHLGV